MSDISERCYSCGWMEHLEYVLWDAIINGERKYGHRIIAQRDISQLGAISKDCQSWIIFDDERGETAIDLEVWAKMYASIVLKDHSIIGRY